ncbi:MAG: BMP family ABC transporter substrate-binding protein [Erysipelotrichaceae bacterium]|jgi:basic membrane protein A|nr:BMP family ABC transporter substrate-binding protein [Erysipelotrichaceae bacterium]
MKKLAQFLFCLSVLSLLLTGCGDKKASTSGEGEKKVYKIAMVSDTIGTEQFILQAYNALVASSEKNGFEYVSLECSDTAMYLEKAQAAAEDGYDLIVGVGWAAAEPFSELADQYPDTRFAVIDTTATNEKVTSIGYNEAEGAYILGVMVATAFPNDDLFGYVSSYQTYATYKYRWGFEQGVLSVNPNAKFMYNFTDSYSDTAKAYEFAMQQHAAGANFIMGGVAASANAGIYQAALEEAEKGTPFYTSGLSVDQTTADNPYLAFGLLKNTGNTMNYIVDNFLAGTLEGGPQILGVKEGGFGVYHITTESMNFVNTDIVTDEVIAAGKAAEAQIKSGELVLIAPSEE